MWDGQGRVWAGQAALQQKLVDGIGGINQAVSLAKKAANIGESIAARSYWCKSYALDSWECCFASHAACMH